MKVKEKVLYTNNNKSMMHSCNSIKKKLTLH